MFVLLTLFLLAFLFFRLVCVAIRAAWGFARVFLMLILFPVILVFMIVGGLAMLALPLILVLGIVSFVLGDR